MHCELPPATNWNFDVQWAPGQLAGIFATATYEGQVSISSLAACSAAVGAGGGDADGFSFGQGAVRRGAVRRGAMLLHRAARDASVGLVCVVVSCFFACESCTQMHGHSAATAAAAVASAAARGKAPAWLKRPCSAAFGFGGKLAAVTNSKRQGPGGEAVNVGSVAISQVMTEPGLVGRSEAFEVAIRGGDREAMAAYCQTRQQQVGVSVCVVG